MKILLLEPIHDEAAALLAKVGDVKLIENLDPDRIIHEATDAAAIVMRGRGRISRAALEAGKELTCVARCGAGTDNIDVATATELGLPVIYSPASTTNAVAEHAFMLMLAVGRKLVLLDREVKRDNWEARARIGVNSELYGKCLAILGLGRIGRRIAELGTAFGMGIAYWSASSRDDRYQYLDLEELFRAADVISVTLALTPQTRKIVDSRLLGLMKPSAILISTGRGDLIDEDALVGALAAGKIAGAGLDVMAEEPPRAAHPLFAFDNVVITPHVAAITDIAYRQMCVDIAREVSRILEGGEPDALYVRNPQVLGRRRNR